MDISNDWPLIRQHFNKSFTTSLHVSIASVDVDNNPNVTPIGTLFLNSNLTGFYFEKFPKKLKKNADQNTNVCVLGVNSGRWFWLKSLIKGKFSSFPAIQLYGNFGQCRKASDVELYRLQRRMKMTKMTKGHQYLWGDMEYVREINFTKAESIQLSKMTKHLSSM